MADTTTAPVADAPSAPAQETTPAPPEATASDNAPLDPVIMKMLDHHVGCTVWYFVDQEATVRSLEEAKKTNPYASWNDHRCYRQNKGELIAMKAAIKNLNPQDAIEAMLASQLMAVHLASIECLNHASWQVDSVENRVAYLSAASKLSRTFTELMKALAHYRGKGATEQKIIVQYVNVEGGAQAIVGNINRSPEGG